MSLFAPADLARVVATLSSDSPAQTQPAPPKDRGRVARWAALMGTGAADAATTLDGRSRGGQEANPAMRALTSHPAAFVGTKLGISALEAVLLDRLAHEHPKAANVLATIGSGLEGGIALHNWKGGR